MRVTVVIPVRDERPGLDILLDRLLAQLRPGDDIAVTDAGSTDGTLEYLRRRAVAEPRLRLHEAPGALPGRGRNLAIAATDAAIIAQIDGGNLPDTGWLEALRAPIEAGRADYVSGDVAIMPIPRRILGQPLDLGPVYAATLFRGPALRPGARDPEGLGATPAMAAGGASAAYRRALWVRAGGFPEDLRRGEDPAFIHKVAGLGTRFTYAPAARIFWQIGPGLRTILARHFDQRRSKYRTPAQRRRHLGKNLFLLAYALLLAATPFAPVTRPWALLLFVLLTGQQIVKSVRTYRQRTPRDPARDRLAVACIAALHVPIHFVWLVATLVGLAGGLRPDPSGRPGKER